MPRDPNHSSTTGDLRPARPPPAGDTPTPSSIADGHQEVRVMTLAAASADGAELGVPASMVRTTPQDADCLIAL